MTAPVLVPDDEHNRTLLAHAHPPDWTDPRPRGRYNLVVLGGGTAGLVAAAGAAGLGARVALVERHLMGGDCLNTGCVPSKAVIRSARAAAALRDAAAMGVTGTGCRVDFAAVMARMRRLRASIAPHDSAARFRDHYGVDVFLGGARFTGRDTAGVNGVTLRFARALIATGSRPAVPAVPGLEEAGYLTSESVFSLTALPARLAVIGAGPVGCELAQAFRRLGAEVTLIGRRPRVLPREDAGATAVLEAVLRREGVRLELDTTVARVESAAGGARLHLAGGGRTPVEADAVLVAAGRTPNVEGLGLEAAGVAHDVRGVVVDDRLRTSNRHVFAAGDVCQAAKYTHAADAAARLVVANALFFGRRRFSTLTIPRCTYTDPEIAAIGLTVDEARRSGAGVDVYRVPLADVDRAVLEGETEGSVSVVTRRGEGRILGATIVAAHAGEMISEVAVAMAGGVSLDDLAGVVHPYPTRSEALRRAGDARNRSRLTPLAAAVLRRVLAWRR